MPQQIPEHRPGTNLHPLDRDPARAPNRPPDSSGTACGFAYQAWLIDDGMRPAYQKVWIWRLADGKRVDGRSVRSYGGTERMRIKPYHTLDEGANVEEKLLRMHVRHMEVEAPVPITLRQCSEVHDLMREKRVGPWKDEITEQDVETERAGGRTMHRLK